jgi:hypothetical protein
MTSEFFLLVVALGYWLWGMMNDDEAHQLSPALIFPFLPQHSIMI